MTSRPSAARAWTTPSAVPTWPQASGPVLQWVRSAGAGHPGPAGDPARGAPSRRGRGSPRAMIASASSRSAAATAARRRVSSPSGRVAGEHAVRGPADRDGGRPRVDQGVGGAAQDRAAGVRLRVRPARPAARARPAAATWPSAGAPRTTISRIAWATSPADLADDLHELVGQAALVDEDEAIALQPERASEAGRDTGATAGNAGRRRAAGRSDRSPRRTLSAISWVVSRRAPAPRPRGWRRCGRRRWRWPGRSGVARAGGSRRGRGRQARGASGDGDRAVRRVTLAPGIHGARVGHRSNVMDRGRRGDRVSTG